MWLKSCNLDNDIENNMEETQVPEFTLYYVTELDHKYKDHLPDTREIKYPWHIYDLGECKIDNLISIFELNELFTEHIDNISQLTDYVRRYESLNENSMKIQLYSQEILPIIQNDKANLEEIKTILHSVD